MSKEKWSEVHKEKQRLLENVSHETAARPFSIHHTEVGGDNTNALYLHCHPEAEFYYLEEGDVTFFVEEQSFELHAGDAMFIPPNLIHHASKADGMPCNYWALVFSLDWLSGYLGGEGNLYVNTLLDHRQEAIMAIQASEQDNTNQAACTERQVNKETDASDTERQANKETDASDTERQAIQEAGAVACGNDASYEILERLKHLRLYADRPIQEYELRLLGELMISAQEIYNVVSAKVRYNERTDAARLGVQKGIDYVMAHYDESVTLEALVECSGYSESHFCHRFKSATGYTPFAYLNRVRVIKAAELLVTTNEKITSIASKCGFDNISYFNRVFRKQMNMSPGQYRNQKG
ncbi:MAG: helix-turn-helix transcriptional regulator [Lachnospiraceae bacterium]|nr:helix-turn-helix transcriptional regulator [Lachnospiraceae bacterium]